MLCSMYEDSDDDFSFLVLGSGPGEEILRFVENNTFTAEKPVHASLLDMDAFALIDFKDQIQYLQVDNFTVEPINKKSFEYPCQPGTGPHKKTVFPDILRRDVRLFFRKNM